MHSGTRHLIWTKIQAKNEFTGSMWINISQVGKSFVNFALRMYYCSLLGAEGVKRFLYINIINLFNEFILLIALLLSIITKTVQILF